MTLSLIRLKAGGWVLNPWLVFESKLPQIKTILICPLNWGLGHASRVFMIIKALHESRYRVIIGADKLALQLLKTEFPGLEIIRIRDITIRYSRWFPAWMVILANSPVLAFSIFREHHLIKKIIADLHPDMIISDNRYGLWNKNVLSVILTHQLSPRLPALLRIFENSLSNLIYKLIRKFDYCWVPDLKGVSSLSGNLSVTKKKSASIRYIGYLSRFSSLEIKPAEKIYNLMFIISGPEPQRSVFLKIILDELKDISQNTLIVSGEPDKDYSYMHSPGCRIVSHLPSRKFMAAFSSSEYIICRAGYTTIMDLVVLGKKALLVPTPGQTEQEYLSRYLYDKGIFPSLPQSQFTIESAIRITDNFHFQKMNKISNISFQDLIEEHSKGN